MVYNTQNYWLSGLCPSSGILNTRKHNVPETGSGVQRLWLALSKGSNRVGVPLPSSEDGNRSIFRNGVFSSTVVPWFASTIRSGNVLVIKALAYQSEFPHKK
jgi:hypothetical protein